MGDRRTTMKLAQSFIALTLLALCAYAATPDTVVPEPALTQNAVPADGKCVNEGDFAIGNHCVLLSGENLVDFQQATNQNFGDEAMSGHGEWCVCLHLYSEWGQGGGDTSQCSQGALSKVGM